MFFEWSHTDQITTTFYDLSNAKFQCKSFTAVVQNERVLFEDKFDNYFSDAGNMVAIQILGICVFP